MGARTLPKALPTTYLPGPTDKIGISQAESRFHLGTAQDVTRGYKKRSGGVGFMVPLALFALHLCNYRRGNADRCCFGE